MRFFPDIHALPPAEADRIVAELLAETVSYAASRSPFYRERLGGAARVAALSDLAALPTTSRDDLQGRQDDFLAVPREEVAEIVSTTGTTGAPVFLSMTLNDVSRLAETERRGFGWMGIGAGSRVHLAVTIDNLFVAGLAYHEGVHRVGAAAVRVGVQPGRRHLDLLRKLRPEGMVAVPSMMVALARLAREEGIDLKEIAPESILLIGDSIRGADLGPNATGRLIREAWGVDPFSTYGLTEAGGAFHECPARCGLHAHPDILLPEVVDEAGRPLPPGETGELAITTLQVEAMPLLRYRTGDVTFLVPGDCPCGRRGLRVGPILGRKRQRLKVKGTTIYPKAIEDALAGFDGVENFVVEARDGEDGFDRLLVRIGTGRTDAPFLDAVGELLFSRARVRPDLVVEAPDAVERMLYEGGRRKPRTFVDLRGGGGA